MSQAVATHGGVRPVEQGEGDSFVVAFARASDAVACALYLQRAPLAPIRLRIGVHTGEVQLRDEGNYIGPTVNRTARLRDLAHGGQTVLSGTTAELVLDSLPADTWLTDLGSHELRGVFRPERVVQLCHPDLCNEFPPLRTSKPLATQRLPVHLTSFVGRGAEIKDVRQMLVDNRMVTLTGSGGAGKTRLAIQTAAEVTTEFADGAWYVDLAPITDPDLVPVAVARALGLPDQPGRSTMDTLVRFAGDRQMLIVLDNCEHLLDACAALVVMLLGACRPLHHCRGNRRRARVRHCGNSVRIRRRHGLGLRRCRRGVGVGGAQGSAFGNHGLCHRLDQVVPQVAIGRRPAPRPGPPCEPPRNRYRLDPGTPASIPQRSSPSTTNGPTCPASRGCHPRTWPHSLACCPIRNSAIAYAGSSYPPRPKSCRGQQRSSAQPWHPDSR